MIITLKELENIDERKFDNSDELWNFIVSLLDIIDDKDESDRNKIERLEIISKLLLDNQVDNIDLVNIKNKSLTKQLPYFKGIIPKNYLIPNNKIIQKLSEIMEAREKGRNLLVSAKKSKKPIIAHCLISYDQKSVNLNTKITEFQSSIDEVEVNLNTAEQNYNSQKKLLDNYLIEVQESSDVEYLDVLFSSKNISEFLSSYFLISELASYEMDLLDDMQAKKKDIELSKMKLEQDREQLATIKANQSKTATILENTKSVRERLLLLLCF